MQRKAVLYDKDGDQHFDFISAWIKSTRGSDPDASLYYLAAMLEGGEDPRFIARRMIILASEDVGNADPQALPLAVAAAHAVEHVGMPECQFALAQAAIYLSLAPKSDAGEAGDPRRPRRTSPSTAPSRRRTRCARPRSRRRAARAAASATRTRTTEPGPRQRPGAPARRARGPAPLRPRRRRAGAARAAGGAAPGARPRALSALYDRIGRSYVATRARTRASRRRALASPGRTSAPERLLRAARRDVTAVEPSACPRSARPAPRASSARRGAAVRRRLLAPRPRTRRLGGARIARRDAAGVPAATVGGGDRLLGDDRSRTAAGWSRQRLLPVPSARAARARADRAPALLDRAEQPLPGSLLEARRPPATSSGSGAVDRRATREYGSAPQPARSAAPPPSRSRQRTRAARYLRARGDGRARRARRAGRPARRRGRAPAQRGDAGRAAAVRRRAARARERRPARARRPPPRPGPGAAGGRRSTLVQVAARRRRRPRARRVALGRPAARGRRRAARRQRRPARPCRPARRRAHAQRVRAAGLPEELLQVVGGATSSPARRTSSTLDPPAAKGTMLVLEGAPLDRASPARVWAAFAGGGRRHAGLGRVIAVRPQAAALAAEIETAARRLRVGDPRRPDTEVGPLAEHRRARPRRGAGRAGRGRAAPRACAAARSRCPGVAGAFYAPVCCAPCRRPRELLREPVPGPVLALQEAATEEEAIALAARPEGDAVGLDRRPRPRRADRPRARRGDRVDQRARRRVAGRAGAARQARRPAPARIAADAPALGPLAAVRPGAAARRDRVRAAAARPRVRALGGAARRRAAARPHRGAARSRGARAAVASPSR